MVGACSRFLSRWVLHTHWVCSFWLRHCIVFIPPGLSTTEGWRTWDSGGRDLIIATLPSLETVSYCVHEIHHIKLIEIMCIVFLTFSILHNRLISKLLSRSRSPNSAILASMSLCHVDSSNCNHICIFQRRNAKLTCNCWSWARTGAKFSPAVLWPLVNKRKWNFHNSCQWRSQTWTCLGTGLGSLALCSDNSTHSTRAHKQGCSRYTLLL